MLTLGDDVTASLTVRFMSKTLGATMSDTKAQLTLDTGVSFFLALLTSPE